MSSLSEFKECQWDAEEIVLGRHEALTFSFVMPAFTQKMVVTEFANGKLLQASAKSGYSDELVTFLFDQKHQIDFSGIKKDEIFVREFDFPAGVAFTKIVVHPPVAPCFRHFPEKLQAILYYIAPVYDSEFSVGMTVRDYAHQIGRKDGYRVHTVEWNREMKEGR